LSYVLRKSAFAANLCRTVGNLLHTLLVFLEIRMQDSHPKPSRRGFFFGAAATGAAAAAIVALPGAPALVAQPQEPKPAPEKGGGYSLTEHVKQYYKTTRI
jgi:hypothetical protein